MKSFERSVKVWKDWIKSSERTRNTWWRAASSVIVTSQAQETESRFNTEERKQRGIRTKIASRGQHVGFVVMSTGTFGNFWQKQSRDGDRQCSKTDASNDGVALLGQHSQATGVCCFVLLNWYWGIVMYGPGASSWASQGRRTHDPRSPTSGHGGEVSHTQRHVNSANGGSFESNHVSHTVRQND